MLATNKIFMWLVHYLHPYHWANEQTTVDHVQKIILPYIFSKKDLNF